MIRCPGKPSGKGGGLTGPFIKQLTAISWTGTHPSERTFYFQPTALLLAQGH